MESIQAFAYEMGKNGAKIWRCFSRDTRAVVPERIGEWNVAEIMPYAFSAHMDEAEFRKGLAQGKIKMFYPPQLGETADTLPALCGNRLEEMILSDGISRIGRYCFYNCENLNHISFTDRVRDWGSGAFTGCHRVGHIEIEMEQVEASTLKDVLAELREELYVDYKVKGQDSLGRGAVQHARLYFPEYYEEGVENTPARILETHVHGSGLYYRNCFQQRVFQFQEYDSRFAYAQAQEGDDFLAHMVAARLRFPYKLSEEAKHRYEAYVTEQKWKFADLVISERNLSSMEWLMKTVGEQTEELADYMIVLAGKNSYPEGMSWLMDFKRRTFGAAKRRRRMEL